MAARELRRVTLVGPECSGKSTLAARLAKIFGTVWSGEFAREYARDLGRPLEARDVPPIAIGQIHLIDRAVAAARGGIVFHDTDLFSTIVYARHYYGSCPEWIESEASKRRADLYMLLPSMEMIPDGVRDPEADRDLITRRFRELLTGLEVQFAEIPGADEKTAIDSLARLSV
ncbi:MAG: ATP-binding protein [Acidobacteria bacterium]|nr:ATP-binding protein [Acidobacteriota bacterium]